MTRAAASLGRAAGKPRAVKREPVEPLAPLVPLPQGYFARSELPLASLAFLLPLVILYEVGTRAFATDPVHQTEQRIIAFSLLQRFFELFGASGRYLPGMAVVGVLLACHIARRDAWSLRPGHVAGMMLESLLLGLPLFFFERVSERYVHHVALTSSFKSVVGAKSLLVLSLGAGIYEELMFRLIAFAVLSFVLLDVLQMNRIFGSLLIVVISAVAFSAYHYLGDEPFQYWTFTFRTLAGIYFGTIFLCRGFGITAGCHAAYDLCVVALAISR